jgi:outer membrane protein TolC
MRKKIPAVLLASFIGFGFSGGAAAQQITLELAIREVCTNSDSVKRMQETMTKSEQMVREKWANILPMISSNTFAARSRGSAFGASSGSGQSSRSLAKVSSAQPTSSYVTWPALGEMFEGFSKPQTTTIFSAGLSMSQPIYTFGKVSTALKMAREFNQASKYSVQRNIQTLQLQAFDAFSQAIMAKKAKSIAEQSLARKTYVFLERNFRLGSGSKAQVLALKADVAGQNTAVLISRRDAHTAQMYLMAIMGRSITDTSGVDTVAGLAELLSAPLPIHDTAIETALSKRTDIKVLDLIAKSNEGGANIYRAMYLPSIAATGSLGYSKNESESKIFKTDWQGSWTVGLGMQWTIFDGFAYSAKAAQFRSDARKMEISKAELSKYIEIEVTTALTECAVADSNLAASLVMQGAAQESYDLMNTNFKQGSGQFADLQLAEEQLLQAQLGLVNARYRQLRSRAALRVAMGNDIIDVQLPWK